MNPRDFDNIYFDVLHTTRRTTGNSFNTDLFKKYMQDSLEQEGIDYRDIDKIVSIYIDDEFTDGIVKKVMNSDKEASDIVEEEMAGVQTSGQIDSTIGMNKRNPKYVPTEIYSE